MLLHVIWIPTELGPATQIVICRKIAFARVGLLPMGEAFQRDSKRGKMFHGKCWFKSDRRRNARCLLATQRAERRSGAKASVADSLGACSVPPMNGNKVVSSTSHRPLHLAYTISEKKMAADPCEGCLHEFSHLRTSEPM